jgi:hypothetical protein
MLYGGSPRAHFLSEILMHKLTENFIGSALRESSIWNFANKPLYDLCGEHPDHVKDEVIIAKF